MLSYGAGQESTWLLYQSALSSEFRNRFAPGRLIVVGSDTGDEHPETYTQVAFSKRFCEQHGIPFYWLHKSLGFHSEAWSSLIGQYKRNSTVGSLMFKRCCTVNLKIEPFYRFLAFLAAQQLSSAVRPETPGSHLLRVCSKTRQDQRDARLFCERVRAKRGNTRRAWRRGKGVGGIPQDEH